MNILIFSETCHSISTQTACFSLSRKKSTHSTLSHPISSTHFLILSSHLSLGRQSCIFHASFAIETLYTFCFPFVLHAALIPSIGSPQLRLSVSCTNHDSSHYAVSCYLYPYAHRSSPTPSAQAPPRPQYQQISSSRSVNNMQSAPIRQSPAMSVRHTNTSTLSDVSLS
jgi:hypothetical protein